MSKFNNSKRQNFLSSIPTASLDEIKNNISSKMKFNFSYFDSSQKYGKKLSELSVNESRDLLLKLLEFSKKSIDEWGRTPIGGGSKKSRRRCVFENYRAFPSKSLFIHPKHVPHQVHWARFRLSGTERLIGFVIPDDYHDKFLNSQSFRFDRNTFYVVFIDPDHSFYR